VPADATINATLLGISQYRVPRQEEKSILAKKRDTIQAISIGTLNQKGALLLTARSKRGRRGKQREEKRVTHGPSNP